MITGNKNNKFNNVYLTEILQSWFWRYYDHLFKLLLINLGWFATCFCVAWISFHLGLWAPRNRFNYLRAFVIYLLETIASLGWAHLVFKIFLEGHATFFDFWDGFKKYFWKSTFLSSFAGLLVFWGLFNIRFYFHLQSAHRFIDLLMAGAILWILLFILSASLLQWPILFFQNPSLKKILSRSYLLILSNGLVSLGSLLFLGVFFLLFNFAPFFWYFIGLVFLFSFQCVTLEKYYLMYKITYGDKPLEPFLEVLGRESRRGWREIIKPWENR